MVSRIPGFVVSWCGALVLSVLPAMAAQPPAQVADVNTTVEQKAFVFFLSGGFASLDGEVYFTADDGVHGVELWRTEGNGTVLVKDVCPGVCGSIPRKLTRVGSRILFFAEDGEHGRELWATDGTPAGTSLVKDIRPGMTGGADVFWMLEAGGTAFFPADDGVVGYELWKTDGTPAGTVLVADLQPGPQGSLPVPHAAVGGTVLLDADDGVHGREPWLTDGTAAGTRLLADINPGVGGSVYPDSPSQQAKIWLATSGGLFLFQANDGAHGIELWASNGTTAGTILVRDFYPGENGGLPFELTELGGSIYFSAATNTLGYELWKTDGTPAGTSLVKDIRPGSGGSSPRQITVFGGRLFFSAYEEGDDNQLWTSDGTEAGTAMVAEIASLFSGGPQSLTVVGGQLLFFADTGEDGQELWKSDGTEAGTLMVSDFGAEAFPTAPSFPTGFLAEGNRFYFRAFDLAGELDFWVSDGTAAGTIQRQDGTSPTSSIPISSWDGRVLEPSAWGMLGDKLIYLANDGTTGNEPWVSDGTPAGTLLLGETGLGIDWTYLFGLTPLGGSAIFSTAGTLWKTDGTPAGTNILLFGEPADVGTPIRIGATAYFPGSSMAEGQELWKTDGTEAGTVLVKDVLPGQMGASPFRLTAVGSRFFFVGDTGTGTSSPNQELWTSDGTAAGTVFVKEIRPGEEPSEIEHPTAVGNRLFFTANDGTSGREPWVSDGTEAGTFRVKDILPGAGDSVAVPPVEGQVTAALGSTFFFLAGDGSGEELWASDGTEANTRRVKDIRPGSLGSEPRWLTAAGGRVYFSADDGVHGRELWISDGTEAGTVLVSDILPGAGSSLPREIAAVGKSVVFSALDADHGVEPWASDGSWTRRLGDIAPGALPSSPVRFIATGNNGKIYFAANDGASGFELWSATVESPLDLYTLSPCRLVDTRPASPLLSGQTRTFSIVGSCGIPAEAQAVAVTLTAISANGSGNLAAWKTGAPKPGTSVLNYTPGVARSNNGIVELGVGGTIDVQGLTFAENGQVHFLLDVTGYFR